MTSHEYAKKLAELSVKMLEAPIFEMPTYQDGYIKKRGIEVLSYYHDKVGFLAAAKAAGAGIKKVEKDDFNFIVFDGLLTLSTERDLVCRIVKPAVPAEYDCEPLLSQAEEASLG